MNAGKHGGLYKYDMRPVYKCNSTNSKWIRIKNLVKFQNSTSNENTGYISFDHHIEQSNDYIFFAFNYQYTYSMIQSDLNIFNTYMNNNSTNITTTNNKPNSIYLHRELLITTHDNLRVDLLTITSMNGCHPTQLTEPYFDHLFPERQPRPFIFPEKQIIFISQNELFYEFYCGNWIND